MADRGRAARKRAGSRRPARKKRRRLGIFGLALLAALILGFLARRVMILSAVHYIADRPPGNPTLSEANPRADSDDSAANAKSSARAEDLTPNDRRQLDAILKHKDKVTGN